ncbi:hypothetical protein FXB40_02010 [Bradyrhizobium rifense]|uniref:Uncharacterized protein n=1 Tax=Bradyrhizobium rifense TaxID=515499 RepID=A0A5D3KN62_9BRAD|nr:hypothetical protein [Bradyrhizobium rifense]TYL99635.1 hypothetical protein FXB40_02010 [Bradyrhizobium rifense]
MFGTDSSQLLRRVAGVTPERRDRSDRRSPLRGEHFPVHANGREIVAQDGAIIAVAGDAAMSEEIVRRLNRTDWNDQEDQWAL